MNNTNQLARKSSYTGRQRVRRTKMHVRFFDSLSRFIITLGGIGTVLSVSIVFLFLFSVVIPLFFESDIEAKGTLGVSQELAHSQSIAFAVNEYQTLGWMLDNFGSLKAFRPNDGVKIWQRSILPEVDVSALRVDPIQNVMAIGTRSGKIFLGSIGFSVGFIDPATVPDEIRAKLTSEVTTYGEAILERTDQGQLRKSKVKVSLGDALPITNESEIALIDASIRPNATTIAALTRDGQLILKRVQERRNLLTGQTTVTTSGAHTTIRLREDGTLPAYFMLSGIADTLYMVWNDGFIQRYDTREIDNPRLAETINLFDSFDRTVTALTFLIGKTTLVVGDSTGQVSTWFRTKPKTSETIDGSALVQVQTLNLNDSAVRTLAASARTRMIAVGHADGSVNLIHTTSGEKIADIKSPLNAEVDLIQISPKDDGLFALSRDGLTSWNINLAHPSVSLKSILTPIWYEGYENPEHVWQSSSGTDDFEPKYGLVPLIFGTLKATFYSMLFGVPLALLAAIYTSEFLHPRTKAKIKPTIEMMASLPSVVLGFLAALVFAPIVEGHLIKVLTAFACIPFSVLLGSFIWQMLPKAYVARLRDFRHFAVVAFILLGAILAALIGPSIERLLFAGDLKAWLDGQIGTAEGGWMILFLPLSALCVAFVFSRIGSVGPLTQISALSSISPQTISFLRFLSGAFITLILALAVSNIFAAAGFDARGTYVDTYVQRNALVVGFVMGFAIIPIIYTISDDALSAVPSHLRAASLACGATPWQTAVRIIIPTAMSGLFSAIMIGLGRAVGETMIVLMAAGNTPLMEMNIFNGFRTLSANIAVELPEAVQHGTHYRMLFFAALTLFLMTFVLNTIAEVVRLRFRKRAFEL